MTILRTPFSVFPSILLAFWLLMPNAGFSAPAKTPAKTPQLQAAEKLVGTMANQAISIINKAAANDAAKEAAKVEFRNILRQNFDIAAIARFTLGRYWRVATPAQQASYTQLLQTVILNKYADRMLESSGKSAVVNGSQKLNAKDSVVNMTIQSNTGAAPVALAWRVRQPTLNAQPKVIDLAVEGVSMSVTHRSDFTSTIDSNGGKVQALIDALKAKK